MTAIANQNLSKATVLAAARGLKGDVCCSAQRVPKLCDDRATAGGRFTDGHKPPVVHRQKSRSVQPWGPSCAAMRFIASLSPGKSYSNRLVTAGLTEERIV